MVYIVNKIYKLQWRIVKFKQRERDLTRGISFHVLKMYLKY